MQFLFILRHVLFQWIINRCRQSKELSKKTLKGREKTTKPFHRSEENPQSNLLSRFSYHYLSSMLLSLLMNTCRCQTRVMSLETSVVIIKSFSCVCILFFRNSYSHMLYIFEHCRSCSNAFMTNLFLDHTKTWDF